MIIKAKKTEFSAKDLIDQLKEAEVDVTRFVNILFDAVGNSCITDYEKRGKKVVSVSETFLNFDSNCGLTFTCYDYDIDRINMMEALKDFDDPKAFVECGDQLGLYTAEQTDVISDDGKIQYADRVYDFLRRFE